MQVIGMDNIRRYNIGFYVSYKETYVLMWNSKFLLKCQTLDQT